MAMQHAVMPAVLQTAERLDRGVVALRNANGSVYVGWRLLASDASDTAFHVYRRAGERTGQPERLTAAPVSDCTNFVDARPPATGKLWYWTAALRATGQNLKSDR